MGYLPVRRLLCDWISLAIKSKKNLSERLSHGHNELKKTSH